MPFSPAPSTSGQTSIVLTSISGNVVLSEISGQSTLISGQSIRIGDNSSSSLVNVNAYTESGAQTRVGLWANARLYGWDNAASGAVRIGVTASGSTSVSGISNKLVVAFSGDSVREFGTIIRANTLTTVTSLSGGTELGSGSTFSVSVRSMSGNALMFIGGTGTDSPVSGKGIAIWGNESQDFKVDNFNRLRIFAVVSGQQVSSVGVV